MIEDLSCGRMQTSLPQNSSVLALNLEDGRALRKQHKLLTNYPCIPLHVLFPTNMLWLCRGCDFPQELILRLSKHNRIQQIQLLAHEYKVFLA